MVKARKRAATLAVEVAESAHRTMEEYVDAVEELQSLQPFIDR